MGAARWPRRSGRRRQPDLRHSLRSLAWLTPAQEQAAISAYDANEEPDCVAEMMRFKTAALRIIEHAKTGA